MNAKSTVGWLGTALALFLFIFFVERHWNEAPVAMGKLLPGLRPAAVTELQVRQGAQFVHLQRAGDDWRLTAPIVYPAQPVRVSALLRTLAELDELWLMKAARLAEFGLAEPQAILIVKQGESTSEIHVGARTPAGDQIYLQVVGLDGIYLADAALLAELPADTDEWRSRALLGTLAEQVFDRLAINVPAASQPFVLQFSAANKSWMLLPNAVRADASKVEQLRQRLRTAQVTRFARAGTAAELDAYGFQKPELELTLGAGTNDLATLQFGRSPTNDPTQIFVRLLNQSNVVVAPRELAAAFEISGNDLRDRILVRFEPESLRQVEVRGADGFTLQFQTNGNWRVTEPEDLPVDRRELFNFLTQLVSLEASDFAPATVTDLSKYGLDHPRRQYIFRGSQTNSVGLTNVQLAALDIGTNGGKYFARRPDESPVYEIREADFLNLPDAGWKMRDRGVWDFSPTNVVRLTLTRGGAVYQLLRNANNGWTPGPGTQAGIKQNYLERALLQLSQLRALAWVARGRENRAAYGFKDDGDQLALEVRVNGGTQTFTVEFGGLAHQTTPYAATTLDGQPWIFIFPYEVDQNLQQILILPPTSRAP